jgi:hypothetical protein
MSLFLSQIEPKIKRELYRRINMSSHGFNNSSKKILDSVKMDKDRHWYSRRKPWIRFTSGGLVKVDTGNIEDSMYSEVDAIKNVLFGGILRVNIKGKTETKTNTEGGQKIIAGEFISTGLRSTFDNVYRFDSKSPTGKRNSPMAGITGITVKNKGDLGSIREAEIKWTCWDEEEFNTLQRLYMTPGISCLLEWGWSIDTTGQRVTTESPFFDMKATTTRALGDKLNPYSPGNIKDVVLNNNGCYDACIGMINNFDWTFNTESGAYDCSTKITAPGDSLLGMELGGSDPAKSINISGAERMDEWFTAKTFQAYVAGAGLRLTRAGLDVREINLETDVQKLESIVTKSSSTAEMSWVGNMLNCTKHNWNDRTKAESSTLHRQERDTKMEDSEILFNFKVGSRIRMMGYPEISRYNGWRDFVKEKTFVKAIANKPKFSGAFFFEKGMFGGGNASFITWAFFEEILINQFFAPIISGDNQTPNPAEMMLLRSCNTINTVLKNSNGELVPHPRLDHYKSIAQKNRWINTDDSPPTTFYESVRIGFNEKLRSINGGTLWIPGYPEFSNTDATEGLRENYDHFQCSKFSDRGNTAEKDKEEGYIRNLMINTNAIKDAFANANTVEDGIRSLLGKMNAASCDYWNLTLQCDENEGGTRLKVIDTNWVEKSVKEIKETAGATKTPAIEDVTFRFPIYSSNTISSGVNMSSQLPDSLKAAIFVGGNKYKKSWHKNDEEEIPVFTEDVIDRYHHFGPYTKKELTKIEEKQVKAQKKLSRDKEKEASEDAEEDLGDVKMTEVIQQSTATYIKSQLYLDPSPYNQYRNNRMIPVNLSLDLDGIGGIYFGNVFTISKLPKALDDRLLFQIKNVTHTVNNDIWKTAIESICRIGEKTESSDDKEYFINQERNISTADSANKYKTHEEARKKKQKKLDDAAATVVAEQNQGGTNTQGNGQISEEAIGANTIDVVLRSRVNIENKTLKGDDNSTKDRKSAEDGHEIQEPKVEDIIIQLTPEEKQELLDAEKAAAEKAVTDATAKRNVLTMTAWFTNDEFPGKSLSRSSIGYLGLEDTTLYSELEVSSGTYKLGTEVMSHSTDREALVLSTHSAVYRIGKTATYDSDVLLILQDMEKYKDAGLLLMWLQLFHLHFINDDFRDWKDADNKKQKDYNGNIFKWAIYEETYLEDKERKVTSNFQGSGTISPAQAGFKTLLGWDGTSEYGSPGGVQFFEMGISAPTHYNSRGAVNTGGIYHWSSKKADKKKLGSKQLDDSLFYNDPEWHPWGPQWRNERGYYYIASKPGAKEPIYSSNI